MNKTSLASVTMLIVCLFFTSVVPLPTFAMNDLSQTYVPLQWRDTILYVGGSGPGNYSKIQDAIDNASGGDTVFVYSGFYEETITIMTSIRLIGQDKNTTIIDGRNQGTVVFISAQNTVLQGFTVQHAKNDFQYAGVDIYGANNVVITQNVIQENGWFGVSARFSGNSQVLIDTNIIRNNSYGVYLKQSPKATITSNSISDNGEGLYLIGSTASQVMNNTVVNRGLGLHLENCYDVVVSGNWIADNANGVYVFNSSEIIVEANMIEMNRWYGLWLKDSTYNIVDSNSISHNIDVGLFLESSFDTIVTNNTVWDNDNGIYLKDCAGNVVQNNNLRNYKMNGCFVAHRLVMRRNIWKSNYWERARMLPYPILGYVKLEKITLSWINIDWTPLRQPPHEVVMKKLHNDGTILYVGGNGPNNYSFIQAAIDDATENDTIYVFNGTYYEAILINKPLRLTGENKTTTILEGNGTRDIITIVADYMMVDNFTITNGHFNILVNHSSCTTITGNNIRNGLHGVSIQNGCRFLTLSKNSFQDNVYGVRLFSSMDVTISHNSFQSFKINAFYYGTCIAHARHQWYQNYWGTPRYLPCIIPGKIRLGDFSLLWFNVDWFPLSKPY